MKRLVVMFALCSLVGTLSLAGVVIEMEATEPGGGAATGVDTLYAEGTMLRMDPQAERGGGATSILFRDDTMWVVDHGEKRCQTIDKQGMAEVGAQLGDAMKEMEAQMAKLPPEQRAMMEQMMKGRMPAGMGEEAPPRRLEKGGTEQIGDYTCTIHTLYLGDEKAWEVCAAAPGAVDGADEAMQAFRAISAFTEDLRSSLKQLPVGRMLETPFSDMEKIDGVPVRVRTYAGGTLQSESTLKSVTRRDLPAETFAVPKGYKVTNLADQMPKRR